MARSVGTQVNYNTTSKDTRFTCRGWRRKSLHASVLTKGLNFAPAPTRILTVHIVTNVKASIGLTEPSDKEAAKARMKVIEAIYYAKMPLRNISHKDMQALKDLANDEKILVLPAGTRGGHSDNGHAKQTVRVRYIGYMSSPRS